MDVAPQALVAMRVAPRDALLDALAIASGDAVANDSGGAAAPLPATRHPQRVRTLWLSIGDTEAGARRRRCRR